MAESAVTASRCLPDARSQSRTRSCCAQEARDLPSGEKRTPRTQFLWSSALPSSLPVADSHQRTTQSAPPAVANNFPSGEKASAWTDVRLPGKVRLLSLVSV